MHCIFYFFPISPSEQPIGTIDLKVMKDIAPYDKKNNGGGSKGAANDVRFNVEMEDKVYKFRVSSEVEAKRWIEGLGEWRDYFLMNMYKV